MSEEKIEENIDVNFSAFLETISATKRLELLRKMHATVTERQLFLMAISADFNLPEGDVETKYEALKNYLLTKEKYEGGRLR